MSLSDDAELLLHRPGAPLKTWAQCGHPEVVPGTILATVAGYVTVPANPPPPGGRQVDGRITP
jgi:hypothetical protein